MIKLRDDIVDLRNGFLPNDEDDSLSRILGSATASRNRGQKREPRPRGRQPGQKVGPRKAAELTGDIKMRLGKAHDLFNGQDYGEASATLMEIIRINAEVPAAWELLAAIFEEERNIKEAVTCLMFAAQVSPKTKIPWIRAATLALSQQGPDRPYFLSQAQSCFAGGIRADPKDLECRRGKAAVLEERGYLTAAVSEYKYIVTRLPEETETLSKIAELCIDNGTCQIAIDVYKRSIAHFRTLPPAQAAVFDWTQIDIYVTLYEVVGQFYNAIAALKSLSRWILGRSTEMFWDQVTLTDCEWDTDESRKITVPGFISGQHPSASYELPIEFRVKLGLYRLSIGEQEESLVCTPFRVSCSGCS
jgi:general transcription factor 3C polypeptide 3 (transcription factor C subunit 4)